MTYGNTGIALFNGSPPPFDFGEGGLWIALARGLFLAALFSSYGTLLYRVRLADSALKLIRGQEGPALVRRYERLAIVSLAVTFGCALLWLVVEAANLFPPHNTSQLVRAIADTLSTSFGHVLLVQTVLVAATLALVFAARKNRIFRDFAMGGIGLAVVLQVGHDHAASMYSGVGVLMVCEVAHLLAAAAWLGSLLPLLVTVRHTPLNAAHAAASRFSSFGSACVRVLVITAVFQGWQLIGSVPGLIGTAYGWMAVAKIVLFSALLLLAASNRYRLTPRLTAGAQGDSVTSRAALVRSIGVETAVGFIILIAASMLVTLPPSIHEQPVWR